MVRFGCTHNAHSNEQLNCFSFLCTITLICAIAAVPSTAPTIEPTNVPTPLPTPNPTPNPTIAPCCHCIDDRNTIGCKQDPKCELEICDIHSFCCTAGWNTVCANLAKVSCTGTSCCDCTSSTPGIAGCAADLQCEQAICNLINPFIDTAKCCSTEWNADCADLAQSFCTLNSPSPTIWNLPWFSPTISAPTATPTAAPSMEPTTEPTTSNPTILTINPTDLPTTSFTINPTSNPSTNPSLYPTSSPSVSTTLSPTFTPTLSPTSNPVLSPTFAPTPNPTVTPSVYPTTSPTICYGAKYQGVMMNDAYLSSDDLFVSNNCLCHLQLTSHGNLILSQTANDKSNDNGRFINIWMTNTNVINLSGQSTVKLELNSQGIFLKEYNMSDVDVLWSEMTTAHTNGIQSLYLSDECVLRLNMKSIQSDSTVTLSPTLSPTLIQTTTSPTYRTPDQCEDKCDAFSVTVEHYAYNEANVWITYKISRLFANGECTKSVKYLVLGMCDEDQAKCTVDDLNGLIGGFSLNDKTDESDDSPHQYIWATDSRNQFIGIRVNIEVDDELSFNLSLKNVFLDSMTFSNAVRFRRGSQKYICYDEGDGYLNGLPCLDWNKVNNVDNAVAVRRQTNNDDTKFMDILDPYVAYSLLSILIVFAVAVLICVVCNNKKQDEETVYVNNKNSLDLGHKHNALPTNDVDDEEDEETEVNLSLTNNEETTLSDEHSLIQFDE